MTKNDDLLSQAIQAADRAHAPYSHFRVGVALKNTEGQVFIGCNIENSSYGATLCAERSAVAALVSSGRALEITEVLIVSDAEAGCPPCGICRQVLSEFAPGRNLKNLKIHLANRKQILHSHTLQDLLPLAFGPDFLK